MSSIAPAAVPVVLSSKARVDGILEQLDLTAPYITPAAVAPFLGITAHGAWYHCRNYSKLRLWKGSYRFYTDDAQHMEILRGLIGRILASGRRLPSGKVARG
ncbi:MAG TPA: hypothetical protein VGB77_21565 [Abditibacteriaceae bacterium]